MPVCEKCGTECKDGEKSCSHCGAVFAGEEASLPVSNEETRKTDGKSEDESPEEPKTRYICPKCRILYEHDGLCIRCGAAVVDQTHPKEEPPPALIHEIEDEEIIQFAESLSETEVIQIEPRQEVKEKKTSVLQKPIFLHRPSNRPMGDRMKEVGSPKKKGKNLARLSREVGSILILVGTAVYLCWSIYSHFAVKRPEASTAISKEAGTTVLPSPAPVAPSVSSPDLQETRNRQAVDGPPVSKEGETAPIPRTASSPASPSSSAPEAAEEDNIRNLLKNIQQGNLRKDIDLFMSCYSSGFKGREGKRKETLENWEHFNYFSLSYDLKNCSVSGNTANARVEWRITYGSKGGGGPEESRTVLDVKFKRENDGWKITEVKPVG